jgi:probable phosphomutase (TIGR03848 family)
MPIFLLIRHGETDFNKKMHLPGRLPDIHLNKTGRQQAQALADKLASAPIKAIYSSPLERTLETAAPLARALNLQVTPLAGLLETDCGEWQGQSVRKLRREKLWQSVQQHPSLFTFPGGESIRECQQRIVQVVESLRLTHSPQDVVACFSHADPIKQAIAFYLGLSLDAFQRLTVMPASVSALFISDKSSQLLMLNYNPSLSWEAFQPPKPEKGKPASKTG